MSIDLRLSPAHERLRVAVATALARRRDEEREPAGAACAVAAELWTRLGEAGALRAGLPGAAEAALATAVVAEELGRALQPTPYGDTMFAGDVLGRSRLGDRFIETIAGGSVTVAIVAGDEGRDCRGDLPLTLEREGRRCVVRGRATLLGSALDATHVLLAARRISGGTVILLVPRGRAGLETGRCDGSGRPVPSSHEVVVDADVSEVVLEDAAADEAWALASARARVRQAAYLVGLAQGALDVTLEYTRRRRAFGRQISTFQVVSFRLAAMFASIDAARLLVRATACRSDSGEDVARRAAQALALAAELALDTVADGIQLHGAYGLTEEAPIQRYYRHAAVEATRLGKPGRLWDEAAARLAEEFAAPVPVAEPHGVPAGRS